jgi:small subunit ribosomal protein S13
VPSVKSSAERELSESSARISATNRDKDKKGGLALARIAGVDLPRRKRIEVGLTYIYGIGSTISRRILQKLDIDPDTLTDNLSETEVNSIRKVIDSEYKVEGELRTEVSMNIKRLMDLGSYRGLRHRKSLPVRGQRTSTNARTRKGPKRSAVKKKGGVRKK